MISTERMTDKRELLAMAANALLWLSLLLSLLFCSVVVAQEGISWADLTEAEQALLSPLEEQWDNFPPERQYRLRRGVSRWQQMAPEERIEAQRQQRLLEQMPQEQRDRINQRFQQFNSVPQGQQQRLREIQRQFRALPPAQREVLRQRFENQRIQREQQRPEGLQNRPAPPGQRPGLREVPRAVPRGVPTVTPPRIERSAPVAPPRPTPPGG